ncbi:MAG: hypothetical protein U0361_09780 [Nitrospiraceae bacterium]
MNPPPGLLTPSSTVFLWLLYQIALIFKPFFLPVLWAAILAHLSFPLHVRLTAWLGGKESRSAALLTLGVMALVVVPLIVLTVMFVNEAGSAEQSIHAWLRRRSATTARAFIRLPGGGLGVGSGSDVSAGVRAIWSGGAVERRGAVSTATSWESSASWSGMPFCSWPIFSS